MNGKLSITSKIRVKYIPVVTAVSLIITLSAWYFLQLTPTRTVGAGLFILLFISYVLLRNDPEAPMEQTPVGCCGGHDVTTFYYGENDVQQNGT